MTRELQAVDSAKSAGWVNLAAGLYENLIMDLQS